MRTFDLADLSATASTDSRAATVSRAATATTALVATLLLTACGPASVPASEAPSAAADSRGSLVVTAVQRPPEDGRVYVEGAREQVVLRDGSGREVARDLGSGRLRLDDVPPGDYTLEAALRPCVGSCGALDPPTDQCSTALRITAGAERRAHVVFLIGASCRIDVEA